METIKTLFNTSWKIVKTGFKAIILFFIVVFIIALFTVDDTGDTSTTSTSTPTTVVDKYDIEIISASRDSYIGILTITGTLTANKDYEYLQIEIPCYDADGNAVGSAMANVSNLEKGDTWKFEATEFSGNGSKYNIEKAEVSGW